MYFIMYCYSAMSGFLLLQVKEFFTTIIRESNEKTLVIKLIINKLLLFLNH